MSDLTDETIAEWRATVTAQRHVDGCFTTAERFVTLCDALSAERSRSDLVQAVLDAADTWRTAHPYAHTMRDSRRASRALAAAVDALRAARTEGDT